jgi:hypothetical protein
LNADKDLAHTTLADPLDEANVPNGVADFGHGTFTSLKFLLRS